jgi:hypothetical protein
VNLGNIGFFLKKYIAFIGAILGYNDTTRAALMLAIKLLVSVALAFSVTLPVLAILIYINGPWTNMENENEISGGVSTVGIDLIHPITKSIDKSKQKGGGSFLAFQPITKTHASKSKRSAPTIIFKKRRNP